MGAKQKIELGVTRPDTGVVKWWNETKPDELVFWLEAHQLPVHYVLQIWKNLKPIERSEIEREYNGDDF